MRRLPITTPSSTSQSTFAVRGDHDVIVGAADGAGDLVNTTGSVAAAPGSIRRRGRRSSGRRRPSCRRRRRKGRDEACPGPAAGRPHRGRAGDRARRAAARRPPGPESHQTDHAADLVHRAAHVPGPAILGRSLTAISRVIGVQREVVLVVVLGRVEGPITSMSYDRGVEHAGGVQLGDVGLRHLGLAGAGRKSSTGLRPTSGPWRSSSVGSCATRRICSSAP